MQVKAHMRRSAYACRMQEILNALYDPTRRGALALLRDGREHCLCALMARLGASQSRMSRHMKVLREAGLVLDRRDAQWVRFRRNPNVAAELTAVVDAVLAAEQMGTRDVA
jgi:ArsR family transcriptional regulator